MNWSKTGILLVLVALFAGIVQAQAPYQEETVTIPTDHNALTGTLTRPNLEGPHPAALWIADNEVHSDVTQMLTDHLTHNGIAVLRYDGSVTPENANAALDFLHSRDDIRQEQIGLVSYGESGATVPTTAADNDDLAFVVTLAAPIDSTTFDDWAQVKAPVLALSGGVEDTAVAPLREVLAENPGALVASFAEADRDLRTDDALLMPAARTTVTEWLLEMVTVQAPEPVAGRDAKWQQNLDYLLAHLPYRHINLFAEVTPGQFEAAAADLRAAIPGLTDEEILVQMMQLVRMVDDEHTALIQNRTYPVIPLQFSAFSDGVYVVAAPDRYDAALQAQLIAVDGTPTDEVLDQIGTIIPHENPQWLRVQGANRLNQPHLLYGLGLLPDVDGARLTFENADGETFTTRVDAVMPSEIGSLNFQPALVAEDIPFSWTQDNLPYWSQYLPEERALFIQYNAAVSLPDRPIDAFIADVFETVDSQSVEQVIVDLRANSGGNSALLEPLIDRLASDYPQINQSENLHVLIGPRTFSSAVLNAIQFQQRTNATLVGEPTGGSPNHFGNYRSLVLPNFDMQVLYSTLYFEWLDEDAPSLMPDVRIELDADDYFAGHDVVLEAVLD